MGRMINLSGSETRVFLDTFRKMRKRREREIFEAVKKG